MKRLSWTLGIVIAAGVATAVAQPPGGPGGRGGPPGGPGAPGGPAGGPPPIIEALDTDHDHEISATELKNATASLLTLDKNKDGKLTEDEFGGPGGPGGRNGGMGRRNGGRGGPGGRGAGGQGGGPGGPGGAPGGRGGKGGGPDGAPGPNPERMIEHAMEFDANKDGLLSKEELTKFVEEFHKHHPGHGGPDGPGGPGGDDNNPPQRPRRPD